LEEIVARDFPYPAERFEGRGIVIPAGGVKYLTCAWVCIKMLRHLGCNLPVELWHLGTEEMDDDSRTLFSPLAATTIDARVIQQRYPVRILNGWEVKPFALLHCRFAEVLLLDADNVPIVDPTFLFDTPKFQRTGAIFWPQPRS
jgi:Mannosyltransferase putative